MDINWTTVIASAVVSIIVTSANFIVIRYLTRALDRMEKGEDVSTPPKRKFKIWRKNKINP